MYNMRLNKICVIIMIQTHIPFFNVGTSANIRPGQSYSREVLKSPFKKLQTTRYDMEDISFKLQESSITSEEHTKRLKILILIVTVFHQ